MKFKNNASYWKKMTISAVGCLIIGIGIGICEHAQLGTDPMTVLLVGLYKHMSLGLGTINILLSLAQIIAAYFLDASTISLATFVAMIMVSAGIDLAVWLNLGPAVLPWNLPWLVLGILVYALGGALSQYPHCGYSPYDVVIFGIQKHTGGSYHTIRWAVDLSYLASGWLLGGVVGIGTVLILLLTGKLIEWWLKQISRIAK
jgi:uncharacterized membrane protein YczE